MNVMHRQIKKLFTNTQKAKEDGLWFSGYKGEGEFKQWYDNGQLFVHYFFKDGREEGEVKQWHDNGQLQQHGFYKQGAPEGEIKMWLSDGTLIMHKIIRNGEEIKDYLR